MKTLLPFVFCLFLVFSLNSVNGQSSPCDSITPHFTIDLTGQPGGTANITPIQRQGLCCNAVSPAACIMATITLDSNSSGIRFDISSGAVPPGALYYQIGCNSPTKVGEPICLNGPGPHVLTFCKPGNNKNGYSITALPKHIVPDTVSVDVGCDVSIGTLGYFVDSSLTWTTSNLADSAYLTYLDCVKGCDTVLVTPDHNSPNFIEYEVCGMLIDTVCQSATSYMCKTVTVQVNSIKDSVDVEICSPGVHSLPDGATADSSGWYITALNSASGCDSIIYTHLVVHPDYFLEFEQQNCDSAQVNGNWYFNSQVVIDSFQTVEGCDSVVSTDLTINYTVHAPQSMISCDSAEVNNKWYYSSQDIRDSFLTYHGCDSLVHTALTINYSQETHINTTQCDSALVHGQWYFSSQLVEDHFNTAKGCDSTVFTHLTINSTSFNSEQMESCDSALVNGQWYYSSQLVIDSFSTSKGCDSVIHTQLAIHYSSVKLQEIESCDSANVHNNWYYKSQPLSKLFKTIEGCDSTVFTELIINKSYEQTASETQCDSALVQGNWYYSNQIVTSIFSTVDGCDSVIHTDLTVHPSKQREQFITQCDRALVHGNWYTTSQTIVDTLLTANFCDSIVTTHLNINYSDSTFLNETYCEGVMMNGQWYERSTTIYNHLRTLGGCDSVVIMKLEIVDKDIEHTEIEACDSTYFKDNLVTETAQFSELFVNRSGCDSIHNTSVVIRPSFEAFEEFVRCKGEFVQLPAGRNVTESGLYTTHLQTMYGCDSVIHTQVTINSTQYIPAPDTSKCLGDMVYIQAGDAVDAMSYEWSNGNYGKEIKTMDIGTYTVLVTTANGCTSIDTIVVHDANCPACPVYVPTGFTINNDKLNESFIPVSACDIIEYDFQVYNRWGELLLRSSDPTVGWDGTYMGKPSQQGVYVWLLDYKDKKSLKPIRKSGTITLLR